MTEINNVCVVHPNKRSEWKLTLRGWIAYRNYWQPKLPNFLYSSNRLFGDGPANAAPTFSFSVPAISKLTTLRVKFYELRRPKPRNTKSW